MRELGSAGRCTDAIQIRARLARGDAVLSIVVAAAAIVRSGMGAAPGEAGVLQILERRGVAPEN